MADLDLPDLDSDAADDQAGAEALDETNLTEDGEDIANFDELDDVYDVTQADGDEDDDDDDATLLDADDLDPDDLDDTVTDEDELGDDLGDYQVDIGAAGASSYNPDDEDAVDPDSIEGLTTVGDADLVDGGEDDFTNFESRSLDDEDLQELGYQAPSDAPDAAHDKADAKLDQELEDTFPASDPTSPSPGSD